ncbi:hypothetical protein FSARC_11363, partial [Fusarium sarcochroum]
MVPLFVSGRAGPIFKVLNIHKRTYGNFHRFVGTTASLEAMLHASIVLVLKPKPGLLATSGTVCFTAIIVVPIATIFFCINVRLAWLSFAVHITLVLAFVGVLLWHVTALSEKRSLIVTAISFGIWFIFAVYRRYRLHFRPLIGKVVIKSKDLDTTNIEVALERPVRVPPGSYFNIFFPSQMGYSPKGYPAVAFWHVPDTTGPSYHLSTVSFLLSHRNSYAAALAKLQEGDQVRLEGPFGQENDLSSYESVMLIAKGDGIAGVLPILLELAERRRHDDLIKSRIRELIEEDKLLADKLNHARGKKKDKISKKRKEMDKEKDKLQRKPRFRDLAKSIDLYWSLESVSQPELIRRELAALQGLDPHNAKDFLMVWCGYPQLRTGAPPFRINEPFWMCLEPTSDTHWFDSLVVSKIGEARKRGRGGMVTITTMEKFKGTIFHLAGNLRLGKKSAKFSDLSSILRQYGLKPFDKNDHTDDQIGIFVLTEKEYEKNRPMAQHSRESGGRLVTNKWIQDISQSNKWIEPDGDYLHEEPKSKGKNKPKGEKGNKSTTQNKNDHNKKNEKEQSSKKRNDVVEIPDDTDEEEEYNSAVEENEDEAEEDYDNEDEDSEDDHRRKDKEKEKRKKNQEEEKEKNKEKKKRKERKEKENEEKENENEKEKGEKEKEKEKKKKEKEEKEKEKK